MAILIEEEKKKGGNLFFWAVVILIAITIICAVYYLFFAPSPLVEKVAPTRLSSIKSLSSIKLKPDEIINNPNFLNLREYNFSLDVNNITSGKTNPFVK